MCAAQFANRIIAIAVENSIIEILRFLDRRDLVFELALVLLRIRMSSRDGAKSRFLIENKIFQKQRSKPKARAGIPGKKSPLDDFREVAKSKDIARGIRHIALQNFYLVLCELFIAFNHSTTPLFWS